MVYVVGVLGFIIGFMVGQAALLQLLRDIPKERLMDSDIRWKYGVFNWMVAGAGSYGAVMVYGHFFG